MYSNAEMHIFSSRKRSKHTATATIHRLPYFLVHFQKPERQDSITGTWISASLSVWEISNRWLVGRVMRKETEKSETLADGRKVVLTEGSSRSIWHGHSENMKNEIKIILTSTIAEFVYSPYIHYIRANTMLVQIGRIKGRKKERKTGVVSDAPWNWRRENSINNLHHTRLQRQSGL